jgi:hypothetical protein
MPAIKLKNGSVILKDGKVSCSCCEECCMYPADMLNVEGGFTVDDLPDINIACNPDFSPVIVTPNSSNPIYAWDDDEAQIQIRHNAGTGSWEVWFRGYFVPEETEFQKESERRCLIGDFDSGCALDQFADCYEVMWNDDGSRSANVTRDDECNWTGTDNESGSVRLRYNSTTTKWEVAASLGTEPKDSNQSAPDAGAGTYGDYTVAEC